MPAQLAAALRRLSPGATAAAILALQITTLYQVDDLERRLTMHEIRASARDCTPPQATRAPRAAPELNHGPAR